MPPFVITKEELTHLTTAIFNVVKAYECHIENAKKSRVSLTFRHILYEINLRKLVFTKLQKTLSLFIR
jgi:hypothetical protein